MKKVPYQELCTVLDNARYFFQIKNNDIFSYFSMKIYFVGTY